MKFGAELDKKVSVFPTLQEGFSELLTRALLSLLNLKRLQHLEALFADVVWVFECDAVDSAFLHVQVAAEEFPVDNFATEPKQKSPRGQGEREGVGVRLSGSGGSGSSRGVM